MMQNALSSQWSGTVWLDVTTSWHGRHGAMNGTMRVEQSYCRELAQIMPETLRLCRYNASRRRFVSVATLPAAARPAGNRAQCARRPPRRARTWSPESSRPSAHCADRRRHGVFRLLDRMRGDPARHFAEARPGDVLLLTGENWSRFDFSVLASSPANVPACGSPPSVKISFRSNARNSIEADGFVERFERYAEFSRQ